MPSTSTPALVPTAPSVQSGGGSAHTPVLAQPSATDASGQPAHTCPDCGRTFNRKTNLDRHCNRKNSCKNTHSATATQSAQAARLLCTVLDVLRGPLNLSEQQAKNDGFVTRVLLDLWDAVAFAAEAHPARAFDMVHRLVVEQLNARQVTLLCGAVLPQRPPDAPLLHSLRSVMNLMKTQHANEGGVGSSRQRIASKLQGMWMYKPLRD